MRLEDGGIAFHGEDSKVNRQERVHHQEHANLNWKFLLEVVEISSDSDANDPQARLSSRLGGSIFNHLAFNYRCMLHYFSFYAMRNEHIVCILSLATTTPAIARASTYPQNGSAFMRPIRFYTTTAMEILVQYTLL